MGGFLSAKLSTVAPDRFAGMSLLVPFFGLYDDTIFKKAIPFAKALNWVRPAHPLKLMRNKTPPKWVAHWINDPLDLGAYVCPHNLLQMDEMFQE